MREPQGNCGNGDAQGKHGRADRDVGRRNVRRLVAPDDPGAQGDLTGQEQEPGVGESRERRAAQFRRARPKQARDYAGGDDEGEKTVSHLQPDLKRRDLR